MVKNKKERGFMDILKDGLGYVSQIISTSIFSKIVDGSEGVKDNIDEKIIQIEKRILRKMYSLLMIGFGGILLILAFFFSLKEFLGWSNAAASFSIGIIIFVIGLMLKIGEQDR